MHNIQLLFSLTVLVFMLDSLFTVKGAPQISRVTSLPGFNATFPPEHYSGYVTLGANPPKELFYYFVVSERNPASDPVVLWLNEGPGCSSLDGFVYEHGPFNFKILMEKDGLPVLQLNPYSWSKAAGIIYLDSPVGAGFSYTVSTYYAVADLQTAADSHLFLLKWFGLFPEFNANPFYILGESYAGVYFPTLASKVDKGSNVALNLLSISRVTWWEMGCVIPYYDNCILTPKLHRKVENGAFASIFLITMMQGA